MTLCLLWLLALMLAAAGLTEDAVLTLERAGRAVGRRQELWWAWPLVAAVSITVLTSPRARRKWPHSIRRVQLGLIVFVGLCGLIAAVGLVGSLLVLGLGAIIGLLAAWVLVVPRWLAPPASAEVLDTLKERDRLEVTDARLKLQNDLRTTALHAIAGLAVLAGAILAFQQLTEDRQQSTATRELTLQGQASERFTRAIDQLGSDRLEMQLGGIYGLEQIAQQAPNNRLAVTEVLVAYLHRRSTRSANTATQPPETLRVRAPDAQAALTVLIRRAPPPTDPPPELGLRGAILTTDRPMNLSRLDLSGADISGATILRGPDRRTIDGRAGSLQDADLRGTDLRGAKFQYMILTNADFRGADLRGADFSDLELPMGGVSPHTPSRINTANFRGALADGSTQWPQAVVLHEGTVGEFDWRAAGVEMK